MPDYQATSDVSATPDALFDYLSDVANLPKYFPRMTSAAPGDGEAVRVTADVHGRQVEGEAWLHVDHTARSLRWGSEGPNDYHGQLDVTGAAESSRVHITLSTTRGPAAEIQAGLDETLASIKQLVEDQGKA